MLVRESKYEFVARLLEGANGTLVDVGARDRILLSHLRTTQLHYLSSDVTPGHDLNWDLEKPLPVENNAFDVVVALDVLEHVENIHLALRELIRISKLRLIISLPNMTCLSFRMHFLRYGQLSGKYALLPTYQGDRHRWLTDYNQICSLVNQIACQENCQIRKYDIVFGYSRWQLLITRLPLPIALKAYTVLFEITKPSQ